MLGFSTMLVTVRSVENKVTVGRLLFEHFLSAVVIIPPLQIFTTRCIYTARCT